MTDISNHSHSVSLQLPDLDGPSGPVMVETYYGFILKSQGTGSASLWIRQILARMLAGACLFAAFGVLVMPQAVVGAEPMALRVGLPVILALSGYVLHALGNRGRILVYEFDQSRAEIRCGYPKRSGGLHRMQRYPFATFYDVAISRRIEGGLDLALLRRDGGEPLRLAQGTAAQIGGLYTRLDRDILRR